MVRFVVTISAKVLLNGKICHHTAHTAAAAAEDCACLKNQWRRPRLIQVSTARRGAARKRKREAVCRYSPHFTQSFSCLV